MGTIKYISEKNRIWEFKEDDWYCDGIEVPCATFYEQGGDIEILRGVKSGRNTRERLLTDGDDPENILCDTGYIYFPLINKGGKREIIRTNDLTKIIDG